MEKLRLRRQSGFTLIELLVVVAIIGILAGIAIPQFAAYRKRGFQAAVITDMKNAVIAQESYYAQYVRYQDATPANSANLPGFAPTNKVAVAMAVLSPDRFTLSGTHADCGVTTWTFNNVVGSISNTVCP